MFLFVSCEEEETIIKITNNEQITDFEGTGFFKFNNYAPFSNKIINVYFHIPKNSNKDSEIVFVFHGNGRNAKDYRDAIIDKANKYGFIVIAPEFSDTNFKSGDSYNLGNIFVDGDNPTLTSLNPESIWTFSVIEPIFNYFKTDLKNTSTNYNIIGHSAGSQFAHRYLLFKPNTNVNKVVLSAAGWYTIPDISLKFPYGIKDSPFKNSMFSKFFSKNIIIQIGELDNDNNANSLRKNEVVNLQGANRFERANYFFNQSKKIATQENAPFNWQFFVNKGLDHSYKPAIEKAADYLFK